MCLEDLNFWYYSVSIAINIMLGWWLKPEIALVFTILSVIHYATVFWYGFFEIDISYSYDEAFFTYIYLGIHLIILVIALSVNYLWAIITSVITIIAFFVPPFINLVVENDIISLLLDIIICVTFVVVDFLLPIESMHKFGIILIFLIVSSLTIYLGEEINPLDILYSIKSFFLRRG